MTRYRFPRTSNAPRKRTERDARFPQKFLKQLVHGFETIRVANIVSEENVVFQKENVVFPAIEENNAILAQLVEGSEIFAKKSAAGFADDVLFHVRNDLRYLLADAPQDCAPPGLQFREPRFDDVRLLAALVMFATLADPFLARLRRGC